MAENKDLKLPSRSYLEGFKARNEALWDKVKNNTFVNMVFPVKDVSEGHTEAILPLVVPGGNAAVQAGKTVLGELERPLVVSTSKTLGGTQSVGRPPLAIIPRTKESITMKYVLNSFKSALKGTKETNKTIQSQRVMTKANKEAGYKAIVEKQERQDVKKTQSLWDRKRGAYANRAKEEIIGDQNKPRLSPYFNLRDYYDYKPKSLEFNRRKCMEKLSKDFHFTESEFDKLFNESFQHLFKQFGGSLNYLNYVNELR